MCSIEMWDQLNSFWQSLHRPFLLPKTLLTVTSLAALCRAPKPGSKDISLYITCPGVHAWQYSLFIQKKLFWFVHPKRKKILFHAWQYGLFIQKKLFWFVHPKRKISLTILKLTWLYYIDIFPTNLWSEYMFLQDV